MWSAAAVGLGVVGVTVEAQGGDVFAKAAQVEHAEQDEHETDRELHGETETRRDDERKEDDGGSDGEDGEGVSGAPESTDERGA